MNLPNKLTIFRIILIPVFLIFINLGTKLGILLSLIIFIIASITDQLDGFIARKYNLITDFGKFMDPLADKLLVLSAFVTFVELDLISSLPVVIIICRELLVTGLRLIVVSKSGKVISADIYGKLKTVFQIMAVIFIISKFYLINFGVYHIKLIKITMWGSDITFYICVLLAVLSGWDYINKNIKCLKETL